jgi:hypothetical protein
MVPRAGKLKTCGLSKLGNGEKGGVPREIAFLHDRLYPIWNGLFLTHDHFTASYAIIRYNIRTYQSAGVRAVVRGLSTAQSQN